MSSRLRWSTTTAPPLTAHKTPITLFPAMIGSVTS